jgi:glycosyltransferase involved in cell wall biosynthesis
MQKILYVQYNNPAIFPPLEHSSQILADKDWQVLFLGIEALGSANSIRFPVHDRIAVRLLQYSQPGWRQKLHYLCFTVWVVGWSLRWRPRWIYASDLFSCPVAWLLTFVPGTETIYHEHDSPTNDCVSLFLRLCLHFRKRLSRRVVMFIVPNQDRANEITLDIGAADKMRCVWNCPTQHEVFPMREPKRDEDLWVLFHGSIVPPRLPITVLHALALLPENVKLRVIGYETVGHYGYLNQLKELATRLQIEGRIEFIGTVPERRELLQWCRNSNVGLAFMPRGSEDINLKYMTGASNKPFDYLSTGLALLVSRLPDWESMFVQSGCGLACEPDQTESIAAALLWFLEHPEETRIMGETGRRRISSDWNYEVQFAPVMQRMGA